MRIVGAWCAACFAERSAPRGGGCRSRAAVVVRAELNAVAEKARAAAEGERARAAGLRSGGSGYGFGVAGYENLLASSKASLAGNYEVIPP